MAKKITLPENPTPEQVEKLKKPLIKAILSEFYLDGIDDLTVEPSAESGTIAVGKFLDRRVIGGETDNRVFEYKIYEEGSEYKVDYKPISGNFAEPDEFTDDDEKMILHARTREPVTLEFAEGMELTEDWFDNYTKQVNEQLAAEFTEVGMGELVEEIADVPRWATTEPAEWAQLN